MTSIFDQHLPRNEANFAALSPLSFIERTAEVYPDRLAIVHGALRQTWAQTYARCRCTGAMRWASWPAASRTWSSRSAASWPS